MAERLGFGAGSSPRASRPEFYLPSLSFARALWSFALGTVSGRRSHILTHLLRNFHFERLVETGSFGADQFEVRHRRSNFARNRAVVRAEPTPRGMDGSRARSASLGFLPGFGLGHFCVFGVYLDGDTFIYFQF